MNYRCFGTEPQTVRLAPLTILVGENSTGKTALAALVRAMWDATYRNRVPDFNEAPYEMGGFRQIAYQRNGRARGKARITAEFEVAPEREGADAFHASVSFRERAGLAAPTYRRIASGGYWLEHVLVEEDRDEVTPIWDLTMGSPREAGAATNAVQVSEAGTEGVLLPPLALALRVHWLHKHETAHRGEVLAGTEDEDDAQWARLLDHFERWDSAELSRRRPYASAPIRSQARRAYTPGTQVPTAEGSHIPYYLADLKRGSKEAWDRLRERLNGFGRSARLFDDLDPHSWSASSPFEIRVRPSGVRSSTQFNLADMGYGVSQVLPIVTELLRDDGPPTMMLQEPEVHLHPRAAAALGTLFCNVVAKGRKSGRQLIVETHSDFITDRCLLAVREEVLRPEDVSIVFFERCQDRVVMHNIAVDRAGHLVDIPEGFRQFFLNEFARLLDLN